MQVKPLDNGRSLIKSIEREDQSFEGITRGWRKP